MSSIIQIDTNVRQAIADAIISDKLNNYKRDNEGGIWLKYDALLLNFKEKTMFTKNIEIEISYYLNNNKIADVNFGNLNIHRGDTVAIQGMEGYIPIHIT